MVVEGFKTSNVRLTLPRGILPIDTADVAKIILF